MGGLSSVVEQLSKGLVRLGHHVEVVTLDPTGSLSRESASDGVKLRRFACLAPSDAYFLPSPAAIEYISSRDVDVIHAHNIGSLLVPACFFANRISPRRKAFVVSPHHHAAGSLWHTRAFWRPYKPLAREVIRSAGAVHCVSNFEASLVSRDFGVKAIVVPNGVSEDVSGFSWHPPANQYVLTYCGRVERYKRVDMILEAASNLRNRGKAVGVLVVGDGPDVSRLSKLARSLDVKMEQKPFLPRDEYLETVAGSTCLVNVSKYEAFSIVTAEALAMGVPAVVSRGWGQTFAPSEKLLLVDGDSASSIASKVEETSGMGSRRSEFLTWRAVARELVDKAYVPALRSMGTTITPRVNH